MSLKLLLGVALTILFGFALCQGDQKSMSDQVNGVERISYFGDLGGAQVRIDKCEIELIEYESGGEKLKGQVARIKSFGMLVYLSKGHLYSDKCKNGAINDRKNAVRLYVSVLAGGNFPGDRFLDRELFNPSGKIFDRNLDNKVETWRQRFQATDFKKYSLEEYLLKDVDPRSGLAAHLSSDTYDIYIARNKFGKVDAFIRCNQVRVINGVATCGMTSSLEPMSKVMVHVRFPRSKLGMWDAIKTASHKKIMSFNAGAGQE